MQNQELNPNPSQNINFTPQNKSNKSKSIATVITIVVLVAAAGAAAYLYMQEKNAHSATKGKLDTATSDLESKSRQLDEAFGKIEEVKYEESITKALKQNTDRNCVQSKNSMIFNVTTSTEKNSDGSVKKRYGVGQYICVNGRVPTNEPVRLVAVQSHDDGKTWSFTYGATSESPNNLPNYIYNTNPSMFDGAYDKPGHN